MARFKKLPVSGHEGKIIYGEGIVDSIVLIAIREVPNVELYNQPQDDKMRNNSIVVAIEKEGVHVDVIIKIHYMQSVSEVAFKIQEAIRHNVESMTEFRVANVNVNIHNVYFDDVVEEKAVSTVDEQEEQEKQEG